MKVLDLFSGIGGFSLGLERAGMETVAFCEYDDKARQVLKKHWPDVPQYNDVRTLTGEQLERDGIRDIGLICGGYPCQPFSTAGKRRGQEDDRHLWPELFRLVQEIRPTWVLCENVAGHISMGLDSVLADLESEAYQCQVLLIPACAVGAYHRRDRIWILGHAEGFGLEGGGKDQDEALRKIPAQRTSFLAHADSRGSDGIASENVAHPPGKRQQRQREFIESLDTKKIEAEEANDALASGQYGVWAVEPAVGRVANGVPGRVDRLKQLGNAVVPQVVEVIGRAIMEAHHDSL